MHPNDVSGQIVDAAMRIHTRLGPGLLESAYEACLLYELRKRGLNVACQVPLPVVYDAVHIQVGYRVDMIVADLVIVELKAVDAVHPIQSGAVVVVSSINREEAGSAVELQ